MAVDLVVYTPDEFAACETDGFGLFDVLRREGVEILSGDS